VEGDISKLLGAPFGVSLSTANVNQILLEKIDRKLQYWCTTHLNLAGREVVVNGVLISACLYYLALWGGTKKGVAQITSRIRNFYWSGTTARTWIGVGWKVCCLSRDDGGLNIIDPGEAVCALMTKWIISACELGLSNFKAMIRYRLS
jgi:hypothetical protein